MIAAGLRSKCSRTSRAICSSAMAPVPNVSTATETGSATPMAYATCTSQVRASSAATMFFAM